MSEWRKLEPNERPERLPQEAELRTQIQSLEDRIRELEESRQDFKTQLDSLKAAAELALQEVTRRLGMLPVEKAPEVYPLSYVVSPSGKVWVVKVDDYGKLSLEWAKS